MFFFLPAESEFLWVRKGNMISWRSSNLTVFCLFVPNHGSIQRYPKEIAQKKAEEEEEKRRQMRERRKDRVIKVD